MLITTVDYAYSSKISGPKDITEKANKISTIKDTVVAIDTSIKSSEDNSFLKNKITYNSSDSLIFDMENKKAYLYNNAVVVYEDMKLEAGYIELDFDKNVLFSRGIPDSSGKIVQKPISTQNGEKFNAGEITYNFKTKKGKIKDVITQQGDGYIHGRDIKKDSNNVYYVAHGKYTTCDLEEPHFYIGAKKIKVIPEDKIITGPAELYIADVPTPLVLPFGFFPNKKGRASGILLPAYGESNQWGFFLKDGGFYFGASEYVDLALRGDIYANGSYGARAYSNYNNRYHYSGNLNLSYSRIIDGDLELPNSTKHNDFLIRWTHSQDPKASPNSRFSASVNAGSSSYNKFNSIGTNNYLSNTLQSNISYSKTLTGTPFNFSANALHSQNTITKKVDISLPELALSMNRIFPFKSNTRVGNRWYDKIGVSATANARNEIHSGDSVVFTNSTLQHMQNGARIQVPISTSFNVLKYFTVSPSISSGSSIYYQSIRKHYDADKKALVTDTVNGFEMANDYSLSTGINTRLYGDYFFRTKRLKQIRHVATPSVTASYRPDFSESQYGYYHEIQIDSLGKTDSYTRFQNGIYGAPPVGNSGLLSFGLNNTLEAKIKQQNDSGSTFKKVSLIDNLSIGSSYNIAGKEFKWSTININGRTKLFKLLDVNAKATIDPYQVDSAGRRVDYYEWYKKSAQTFSDLSGRRLGRLTAAGLSLSTSLRSKEGQTKKKTTDKSNKDEVDYVNAHPDAYVDFNIPWTLNFYYNADYSTSYVAAVLTKKIIQSANFSGDVSVTKNWKISVSSGYDFTNKKFTVTNINIYRDLHCWEMRFRWVPFGFGQSFNLDINIKSATLKDMKLTRKKDWYDYK